MSVIQQSDPQQDRTKAARVTDEQGKRTVIMKGPISQSFYMAMNQVLAKDSTSEIGYSFESLEDGTLVIDPSAPHGIRSEPGTDTQVIAYGQQAKDVSVEDAAEFAKLVASRQEGTDVHLVLTGEGESDNAQMLRAVASANSVPCHETVQRFLDEITGKEPVAEKLKNNFSQESSTEKPDPKKEKEGEVDDALTALDVGGQVRDVVTENGEKAVELDEAYSQESLGKIMQSLADFFGGIDRKIVIMQREVTELLNRSSKKDREAIAVGRRYINTRRGVGLAFGKQMCEDAEMVTSKLLEITEPIKLFSELTNGEFVDLARYCDSTISNMEQKRFGSGAYSIKEVRSITNKISEVVSPMFTERGIMANRYVLTSKLMLNNVIMFPTALGRDAYLPMIGRLADKGNLGVKGPSLCSVGQAEDILNNILEINSFLGQFMKQTRTLIAGREWDLSSRIQELRSSTIKTDTEGNNYVVSLSEEDDMALRYVIGILTYLESLARVMYHAVYPVLEVTFDYCKVSVEAARKPEGA